MGALERGGDRPVGPRGVRMGRMLGFFESFPCGFFIFIFFIFIFYKNIFLIWKFTEIYPGRPAAGRPGPGRPVAGRQGLIRKKKDNKKLQTGPWGPAARQRGGRPPGRPAAGRPALFFAI